MNEHSSRSHAIFIITIECSEVSMTKNELAEQENVELDSKKEHRTLHIGDVSLFI